MKIFILILIVFQLFSCSNIDSQINIDFTNEYLIVHERSEDEIDNIFHNKMNFFPEGTYKREENVQHYIFENNKRTRVFLKITDMRGKWELVGDEVFLQDKRVVDFYCYDSNGGIVNCGISKDEIIFGTAEFIHKGSAQFRDDNILIYKVIK